MPPKPVNASKPKFAPNIPCAAVPTDDSFCGVKSGSEFSNDSLYKPYFFSSSSEKLIAIIN